MASGLKRARSSMLLCYFVSEHFSKFSEPPSEPALDKVSDTRRPNFPGIQKPKNFRGHTVLRVSEFSDFKMWHA